MIIQIIKKRKLYLNNSNSHYGYNNLEKIKNEIPNDVLLVAVSKTKSESEIIRG